MSNNKPQSLSKVYQYITKVMSITAFDWSDVNGGLKDIFEELEELKHAETAERRFEEAGDVLFATLNWLRWLGVADPEAALGAAAERFQARHARLQARIAAEGKTITEYTLAELQAMWESIKHDSE
jgi:uncharacterized protein YabN with tetrapyrrole methylase and pyrophosphatase domain